MGHGLGCSQGRGCVAKPWGRGQGVGPWPNGWEVAKAMGSCPRPWGRGQGRGGVTKTVGA